MSSSPDVSPEDIREVVDGLLTGEISREHAAHWAMRANMVLENATAAGGAVSPDVADIIDALLTIDTPQGPFDGVRRYMYDFDELRELRARIDATVDT